jgi:hypothetical protein
MGRKIWYVWDNDSSCIRGASQWVSLINTWSVTSIIAMSRETNDFQSFIEGASNLLVKSDTVLWRRGKHEITEIHWEHEDVKESTEEAQGSSDLRNVKCELHNMKHETWIADAEFPSFFRARRSWTASRSKYRSRFTWGTIRLKI